MLARYLPPIRISSQLHPGKSKRAGEIDPPVHGGSARGTGLAGSTCSMSRSTGPALMPPRSDEASDMAASASTPAAAAPHHRAAMRGARSPRPAARRPRGRRRARGAPRLLGGPDRSAAAAGAGAGDEGFVSAGKGERDRDAESGERGGTEEGRGMKLFPVFYFSFLIDSFCFTRGVSVVVELELGLMIWFGSARGAAACPGWLALLTMSSSSSPRGWTQLP